MRSLSLAAVALVFLARPVWADEESVPLDKVPKPVMEAVKKRFPKAEAKEASKEGEKDKVVYEVTLKQDGKNIDVTLTPDGAITLIEKEIAFKDLPKPVAEVLDKKYPKATYKIVEEVISVKDGKEALDYYEALLVTAEKKTFEVEVLADGKIKAETEKKEENEQVRFVGGDDDKNKKGKKREDEDDDKGKGKKGDDDKNTAALPKALAESVKSKFPGAKVVGVTKDGKGEKATYEVELRYKTGTLEAILSAKGDVLEVELKGKDSEDDKSGKKGEKAKSSGFRGEQKGQNEDEKSKKGDDDDKNEKGKKKKKDDDK